MTFKQPLFSIALNSVALIPITWILGFGVTTSNADVVVTITEEVDGISYSFSASAIDTTGLTEIVTQTGGNVFFSAANSGFSGGLIGGGASFSVVLYRGVSATLSAGWTQGTNDAISTFAWTTITGSGSLLGSSSFIGGDPTLGISGTPDANGVVDLDSVEGFIEGLSFADVGLTANESIRFDWASDSVTFQTVVANSVPSVSVQIENNELPINATQGPDDILVTQVGNTLEVEANDDFFETFALANVNRVVISGFGGADRIEVDGAVATLISGGFGADVIVGGSLENEIFGGPGGDTIIGGPLDDVLNAGRGQDTVFGFNGNDQIIGGDANDILNGGLGDDEIFGGLGGDTLNGNAGNDLLIGNVGADTTNGGGGNDELIGLGGPDQMFGGSGDDEFSGGEGFDTFNGGGGIDSAVDNGEVEISIENT